jgi:hypothetical protein
VITWSVKGAPTLASADWISEVSARPPKAANSPPIA